MRNALKAKEEKAQEAKETFNNLQVPRLMSEKTEGARVRINSLSSLTN